MSTTTAAPTAGDVVAIAQPPASTGHPVPDLVVRVVDDLGAALDVVDVDPITFEPTSHVWQLPVSDLADSDSWEVLG